MLLVLARLRSKDQLEKTITRMIDIIWIKKNKLGMNNQEEFFNEFYDFAYDLVVKIAKFYEARSSSLIIKVCGFLIFFINKSLGETEVTWEHNPVQSNSWLRQVFQRREIYTNEEVANKLTMMEELLKRRIDIINKKLGLRKGTSNKRFLRQKKVIKNILKTIPQLQGVESTGSAIMSMTHQGLAKQRRMDEVLAKGSSSNNAEELEELEEELNRL